MASTITLKAIGLNRSPNFLDSQATPPGSLLTASNIIIKRDSVMESRRGYPLYGTAMGTSSDRAKQLMVYKGRILRHFSNKLQYDTLETNVNNESIFNQFSGTYLEPETGRRIRSLESNGNLYFTSDSGIKKISARTAADFTTASGFITQAGGIKAIDLTSRLLITLGNQTGFLPQDSAVAYRAVWGSNDANSNEILGAPSQRSVIYNSMLSLEIQDFNRLLIELDNVSDYAASTSLISDGDYFSSLSLVSTSSAQDLHTNLIALAEKIDNDILYADDVASAPLQISGAAISGSICTISFASGDPTDYLISGSLIKLTGFTPASGTLDGVQTVATVTSSTLTFNTTASGSVSTATPTIYSDEYESITQPLTPDLLATNDQLVALQLYLQAIITQLQSEPDTGTPPTISSTSQTDFISPLDITTTANVLLRISIPQGVTVNNFLQLYRSSIAQATGTQVLSTDIFPNDELKLIYEAFPTATDISNGYVEITDITPPEFAGAFLYTNATTGEGILQANNPPPFAVDINRFKNCSFYANTRTLYSQLINLLGVVNMINDFNTAIITKTFTSSDVNTGTNVITISSHGFANGETVFFSNPSPTSLPGGIFQGRTYYIISATNNTFKVSETSGGSQVDITSGGSGTHTIESHEFPKIVITDGTTTHTYNFVTGLQEIDIITTRADSSGDLAGKYFDINSANDFNQYRFYYIVNGSGSAPSAGGRTLFPIYLNTNDSNSVVADKTSEVLASFNLDFSVSTMSNVITTTLVGFGPTTDLSAGTSGFTVAVAQQGRGENSSLREVLLSTNVSPAQAVDETARSLVHVINQQANEIVDAFYLSDAQSVPGQMQFEARNLNQSVFYILANDSNTGQSFNPDISPNSNPITAISMANPTIITVPAGHGLINQDKVVICASNSTPSVDGLYTATVISSTTFSIPVNVTVAGTSGSFKAATTTLQADNLIKANRIYYSKVLQPEAVPALNFIDVGAQDKAILRIFPLRDSLFVYKEDGLYRISGETAPFNLALFDLSCILIAADSLDISNNLLYGWSTQGIISTSESGVNIISRPIDIDILKLASHQYVNFPTATWGIGYESDNCYQVATVQNTNDTKAEIVYRYSTLTNTWTTWDKSVTCGVINPVDDKEYFGSGNENFLEQERKDFARTDYSDHEHVETISAVDFLANEIKLSDITVASVGDVVTQEQYVTVYNFNNLLQKLDGDLTLEHDYQTDLTIARGSNVRISVDALLEKVANDAIRTVQAGASPGSDYTKYEAINGSFSITGITAGNPTIITCATHGLQTGRSITITGSNSSPSIDGIYQVTVLTSSTFSIPKSVTVAGTSASYSVNNNNFLDVQTSYNGLITTLNADPGITFGNYNQITNSTVQETVIIEVNEITKNITLELDLNLLVGPITIYNAILTEIQYTPQDMQDPLSLKHFREALMFFEDKAFSNASLAFSSDLLPVFDTILFNGTTNGIFGFNPFGYNFFGGGSNSAPYRTYIPRNAQRCRYLNVKFEHKTAREKYSILGLVIVGNNTESSRAYR